MNIAYENDTARGRGHGILRLTDINAIAADNARFSLCRAADMCFLSKHGWHNAEDFHTPQSCMMHNGALLLYIGPDIVDQLHVNENYRLTLILPDGQSARAVLAIESIHYSLAGQKGNAHMYAESPAQEVTPEVAPALKSEPETDVVSMPEPVIRTRTQSLWPVILGICVLGILGGAWWYMLQQSEPEPKALSQQEAKPEPASKTETPLLSASPVLSAREQVRAFFASSPVADVAIALAKKLPAHTAEEQDALYRLYYFAAGEKNPAAKAEALPILAQAVDPSTPAWGSIAKDAAEAWSNYQKMLTTADAKTASTAKERMDALHTWLTTQASKGNAKAALWLERIEQLK